VLAAILLLVFSRVDALTYLGVSCLGDPIYAISPRSLGMGGTSIASAIDSSSILGNPSCLGVLDRKELQVALGIAPVIEKVATEEELTYLNSQCYFQLNSTVIAFPFRRKFVLALGFAPLYDNNYKHEKSIFNAASPGEEIGFASMYGKGALYNYTLGGVWKLAPYLYIGGAINFLNGTSSLSTRSRIYASPPSSITELESRISGCNFTIGGLLCFTDELKAGFVVRTEGKVEDRWKVEYSILKEEGKTELVIPPYYGFGIAYSFLDEFSSIISAEAILSKWSKFELPEVLNSSTYRDIFEFRVGAEHYLGGSLFLRYGFNFEPFYGGSQFQMVSFTGGIGYKLNDMVSLDLAGELGKRNYYGDAAFFEERQRIDETVAKIMVGVKVQH